MLSGDKVIALHWLREASKNEAMLKDEAEKAFKSLLGALSAEEREAFADFLQ